jgi:hypothetical protein
MTHGEEQLGILKRAVELFRSGGETIVTQFQWTQRLRSIGFM